MSTEAFNVRVAQCGGCGAEISFAVGSSRLRVCDFCGYVTARTDGGGVEGLGKVADVVPTGARLTLGATGTYDGVGFRLAGRIQLAWEQGAWDEWYAAFDDGRWGWLAEAQGRYFVSFRTSPRHVPPLAALHPGRDVVLHGLGRYVVTDLKSARYTAARGELPEAFPLDGRTVHLVDLSGADRSFATLDFGETGRDPIVFSGHEVTLDDLRIGAEHVAPPERVKVQAKELTCPNCNAPIPLRAPDETLRVTCTHCATLLDASTGTLKALTQLKKAQPRVPLGAKGAFEGVEWLVIGWMERACNVDGETYTWEEWLLYDARTAAFRYLLCSDNHWSFVTPIAPGDVEYGPHGATYKGTTFRRFSSVSASVRRIWGEFPWAVKVGEEAIATDYIAPPQGLSHELSGSEVNWSLSTYLTPDEVTKAFGLKKALKQPSGVGAIQPSPWGDVSSSMARVAGVSIVALIALFALFAMRSSDAVVLHESTTMVANRALGTDAADVPVPAPTPEAPYDASVAFSQPFEIDRPNRNLRVEWSSNVNQSWVSLNGALVNESTGEFLPFGGTSMSYAGVEDGESWSEGDRDGSTYLSRVPMGRYVLRLEAQWPVGTAPPTVTVRLVHGVARVTHLLLALLALGVLPAFALFRSSSFERERWEQSSEGGE